MYLRSNPLAILRLASLDMKLKFLGTRPPELPRHLKKILLCNPAHMGDALICTAVVRKLKEASPDLTVDFLGGSWAAPIIDAAPGFGEFLQVDHWMLNRANISKQEKKKKFQTQIEPLKMKIQAGNYDAAFISYAYEPSLVPVFRGFTEIPLIGFSSNGHSPALSHTNATGHRQDVHEVVHQSSLFSPWWKFPEDPTQFKPWIDTPSPLPATHHYIVLHPGCGSRAKEWPVKNWASLIRHLEKFGCRILVTGHGERETEIASTLAAQSIAESLVGQLDWNDYLQIIRHADLVIGVDSMACHLAAAFSTPSITIASPISNMNRWRPLGLKAMICQGNQTSAHSHDFPSVDQVIQAAAFQLKKDRWDSIIN